MSFIDRFFKLREENDVPKPFLEHLEDLRKMIIKMVITLVVAMIGCFFYRKELLSIAQRPLKEVDPNLIGSLLTLGVAEPFMISIKLAFYAGIVVSFPLLLFFLAQFVVPALTRNEKKYVFTAITVGFGLFLLGVLVCYFYLLPQTLHFFFNDAKTVGLNPSWTATQYFSFVTHFIIAFGLCFELPVVVLSLVSLKLISYPFMAATRPYAVVLLMVFAAIIAPTPDVITFLSFSAPLCLLYEACIWLAWLMERRQKKQELEPTVEP